MSPSKIRLVWEKSYIRCLFWETNHIGVLWRGPSRRWYRKLNINADALAHDDYTEMIHVTDEELALLNLTERFLK